MTHPDLFAGAVVAILLLILVALFSLGKTLEQALDEIIKLLRERR